MSDIAQATMMQRVPCYFGSSSSSIKAPPGNYSAKEYDVRSTSLASHRALPPKSIGLDTQFEHIGICSEMSGMHSSFFEELTPAAGWPQWSGYPHRNTECYTLGSGFGDNDCRSLGQTDQRPTSIAYQQTSEINDPHFQTRQPVQLASAIVDYAAAKRHWSDETPSRRGSIHRLHELLPMRDRLRSTRCVQSESMNYLYDSDLNSTTSTHGRSTAMSAMSATTCSSQSTSAAGNMAVRLVPTGPMNPLVAAPDSRIACANMGQCHISSHAPPYVGGAHTESLNSCWALPGHSFVGCSNSNVVIYNEGEYSVEPTTRASSLSFQTQQQQQWQQQQQQHWQQQQSQSACICACALSSSGSVSTPSTMPHHTRLASTFRGDLLPPKERVAVASIVGDDTSSISKETVLRPTSRDRSSHVVHVDDGASDDDDESRAIATHRFAFGFRPTAASMSIGKTRTREKYRTVYSERQKTQLELEYTANTYISADRKVSISRMTGLTERQVKIWFQNSRAKDRKMRYRDVTVSTSTATSWSRN